MRFHNARLQAELTSWRSQASVVERSKADNGWFEERVSAARLARFENFVPAPDVSEGLDYRLVDYWKTHVRNGNPLPDTFHPDLEPASLAPGLEPFQPIIRVEDLRTPLANAGLSFEELQASLADPQRRPTIENFLSIWNDDRDTRPVFAAWKDQLYEEIDAEDWPERLRDRLGLAHYDPTDGRDIHVALMEYTVDDVMKDTAALNLPVVFTAPTVLDCKPWPYFFPSPQELPYGRAMALYHVDDERRLLAEMLHPKLTYRFHHISKLGMVRRRPVTPDLKELRNRHLLALQVASVREDFGEAIP